VTAPSKIHRQDPEHRGVAVCGRKSSPERMTTDPRLVTCGVCATWQNETADPSPTVLDRLGEAPADFAVIASPASGKTDTLDAGRTRGRATGRALRKLAARHPKEFEELFRAEYAATIAEEEELGLLSPLD
jgi:hypothetical protein